VDYLNSRKWGDVNLDQSGLRNIKREPASTLQTASFKKAFGDVQYVPEAAFQKWYAARDWLKERGSASTRDMALLAAGTGLALYLYNSTDSDEAKTLIAGLGGALGLDRAGAKIKPTGEALRAYEAKLIEGLKAGGKAREAAAKEIYLDNAPMLERSLRKYERQGVQIEDVVQRTMEKGLRAMEKGQFSGEAAIQTYLYRIADNEAKGNLRYERVRPQTESLDSTERAGVAKGDESLPSPHENVADEAAQSPEAVAANNTLAAKMSRALDKLPEDFRRPFEMRELQGMDYQEISDALGVPLNTVRTRILRAKEKLQSSLQEYNTPGRAGHLQAGQATTKQLVALAAVAGGALLGSQLDPEHPLTGALKGTAGGFILGALTHLSPKGAASAIAGAFSADTRLRIDKFADAHDAGIATAARAVWQQMRGVMDLAPKADDRALVTHAIQQNRIGTLSPPLQQAALRAKAFFDSMAQAGLASGVLKDTIEHYVTNLWDLNGKNKQIWDGILAQHGGPSMSPNSRFALKRSIANLEVGKKLGLIPRTEDVAAIMDIYGNSLSRSMENAALIKSLKAELDPQTGEKLVMSGLKAPHSYVSIESPQMAGMRVHPDIAPSMRFLFEADTPGTVRQAIQAVNTAIKRSAVMASLFHAKALLDGFTGAAELNKKTIAAGAVAGAAYGVVSGQDSLASSLVGAGIGMMLPGMKHVAQAAAPRIFGENIYLKQLRTGQAGDLVDQLIRAGLKISFEKGKLAVEDVGGSFYTGMTALQKGLDAIIPHSGLPVKAVIELSHALDGFMWERLHAGMKLATAAQKLEVLIENNAKANARDPSVALRSREALATEAASFTNDIFGGLDWRRIAEATHTRWGRDIALQVYSPKGRAMMQLAIFAPDWTISTARAATQAFVPSVSDLNPVKLARTFTEPQNAVALHRQYMIRSALYYAAAAGGLNYMFSGHFPWDKEQKDWTTIDMGDGRTMQWSKHMMEPVHWVTKPLQQGLNKLGFFPKEILNQVTGKEYASAGGNAPPMDTSALGRLEHVAKSTLPIAAQQAFGAKASQGGAVSGFLGVPIYGKTNEERAAAKQALKELHASPEWKAAAAQRRADKRQGAQK